MHKAHTSTKNQPRAWNMATASSYSPRADLSDDTEKTVLRPSQIGRRHKQTFAMKQGTACPVCLTSPKFLLQCPATAGRTGRMQPVLARQQQQLDTFWVEASRRRMFGLRV